MKDDIIASLPSRGGKTREVTKEDFSQRGAIYLRPHAQFDTLVGLPDSADRAQALITAMESIEADYSSLAGVLPKAEYQQLENSVLGQLLRTLNPEELKKATGDIFGRIYEYFLTAFADVGAHDGGEFFTPVSLVRMITNFIEPDHGKVLDPACGSGGMFVQSAHFVERLKQNPSELLTFYGAEKNATTIRLAKMNLAVHGLSGDIQKAISYYEDPHELLHKADFVMANPPFNVDEVDAEAVKNDPRLPFGLPGVNKGNKVSNGNYLWISYFYSYLNDKGRAGFVMSSQASSAGRDEARVRQKLVETGHVDAMVAIRSNFFYTRTVPCELWFFDKAKSAEYKEHVLMLDARNTYRKVTRKIYDFAPEQLANLTAIVWLYRGEQQRFLDLVAEHLGETVAAASDCGEPLIALRNAIDTLTDQIKSSLYSAGNADLSQSLVELEAATADYCAEAGVFDNDVKACNSFWLGVTPTNALLLAAGNKFKSLAEHSRDLIKDADQLCKLASRLVDAHEQSARESGNPANRELSRSRKAVEESRKALVDALKKVRHCWKAAHWLQERFPSAELRDIPGLVKRVSLTEIAENDWSLTPGRYVGIAPEEQDEDFDFEQALSDIHIELLGLNEEATELAKKIAHNFEGLGA
ncbi:hsdM: type I restriction-modification system, M subunit [compost metagenome]